MNFTESCVAQDVTEENLGIAFALVIGAGLATSVGATVPCCLGRSCCLGRGSRVCARRSCLTCRGMSNLEVVLSSSLAFSAGVMLYVSFVEILMTKALESFRQCLEPGAAYSATTGIFFGGMFLAWLLHQLVHALQSCCAGQKAPGSLLQLKVEDVEEEFSRYQSAGHQEVEMQELDRQPVELDSEEAQEGLAVASLYTQAQDVPKQQLVLMTTFVGLAIFVHNLPEGLATFVGALDDPSVGAVLAVAIALHNIPEGMVVAIPVYVATKSRVKAFLWGSLSGITEPVGALLGWAILARFFDPIVYGVLFSLVSGIMVYISLVELLPAARRYDKSGELVNACLFAGFFVMALSLVLFQL